MGLHLARSERAHVGLDFAPGMLDLARQRLPAATFIECDIRALQLDRTFALVVGWDSFFDLTPEALREPGSRGC
jgi:trans-aconitate methyltransferase